MTALICCYNLLPRPPGWIIPDTSPTSDKKKKDVILFTYTYCILLLQQYKHHSLENLKITGVAPNFIPCMNILYI